ncbi:hypothetical protein S726_004112 [Salmonella enterica subsp. enterica]|nr:hypothetical protein [Salmonella enterica subsp. enterica]
MMKKMMLPADAEQYTGLVIDFFSDLGWLYTLRYDLPAGTPQQSSRRVSQVLSLTRKALEETGQYAA